ncbi:alpha/beta hydrolase [Haloechinothrix sp. LS1_15]|uniref:alpha/beta hydrolase n=1 Tax=Haloechinothrix sp. LS1_15 TaxID=2652248 RepID=UPI0029467AA4|nr:alpha/beta hydrolase [Haloechinothrix sp. LS1_15]MDV6012060.1 alpha/beta hydrolase [Haloechinothrix sp. LS1_15]
MRRLSRSACALAACLVVTSCGPTALGDPTLTPAEPLPQAPLFPGPLQTYFDQLDGFYEQELSWEDCEPYASSDWARESLAESSAECARLEVPLDYEDPDGETITVGVSRVAAQSDDMIGSLVTNPGGPGMSGLVLAATVAGELADTEVGERFDIVGFDPRGIGSSEPTVECLTDAERDDWRSQPARFSDSVADAEEINRELVDKCVERTEYGEEMLANVGTRDVVHDLDVLRAALGDEQLNYLGYSYGTRIGYTYAETFPTHVRALVLDGAMDPERNIVDTMAAQGEGFGDAFEEFAAWCTERHDCPLGHDPDAAVVAYQDLVRPLVDDPLPLNDGRELTFANATTATIQALYSEGWWEFLLEDLQLLRQGHGETLMLLADVYNRRNEDGSYPPGMDAGLAISCVDDEPVTDRDTIAEANEAYLDAAPFLDGGEPLVAARGPCASWPVSHTLEHEFPSLDDVPPPLVISATSDPATPHEGAEQLADGMDGALLTFEGAEHGLFAQGHGDCIDDAGVAYLVDGTLPEEGTTCGGD